MGFLLLISGSARPVFHVDGLATHLVGALRNALLPASTAESDAEGDEQTEEGEGHHNRDNDDPGWYGGTGDGSIFIAVTPALVGIHTEDVPLICPGDEAVEYRN